MVQPVLNVAASLTESWRSIGISASIRRQSGWVSLKVRVTSVAEAALAEATLFSGRSVRQL